MGAEAALALAAVAYLLAKHWLFDFVVQTRAQLAAKGRLLDPAGLSHAGLHALASAPVLLLLPAPPAVAAAVIGGEAVVHHLLDWAKARIVARTGWGYDDGRYWTLFGADQLLHGGTYLGMAAALSAAA